MALLITEIKALKPKDKPYMVADGAGLNLHVATSGTKTWRLRYRLTVGTKVKARTITLGEFPNMMPADARAAAIAAKVAKEMGQDPVMVRRVAKLEEARAREQTYAQAFWLNVDNLRDVKKVSPVTLKQVIRRHEMYVLPVLGLLPIAQITPLHLAAWSQGIQAKVPGSARHTATTVRQVFRLAARRHLITVNPAEYIHEEFPAPKVVNRPALRTAEEVAKLLQDADKMVDPVNRAIFRLHAYLYSRPVELLQSTWSEFDLDAAVWTLPAEREKTRTMQVIPLPRQAVKILRELKLQGGGSEWICPNAYKPHKPSHKDRINQMMKRHMPQYEGKHVPHGFRSTASTILGEAGFNPWLVERSLGHALPSSVMGIYSKATWVELTRDMRQNYADYLDMLAADRVKEAKHAIVAHATRARKAA